MEAREEYRKALKDYDDAVRLDPTDAKNFAARGGLYSILGEGWRGEKNWAKGVDAAWRAVKDARNAVEAAKKDVDKAEKDKNLAAKAQGLYEKGKDHYERKEYFAETLAAYFGQEPEYVYMPAYREQVLAQYKANVSDGNAMLARYNATLARHLNELAWTLATAPDDKVRNGREAVELASEAVKFANEAVERAKKGNADDRKLANRTLALYLDTLAAAYAEMRNFQEAIQYQERAIGFLPAGDPQEQGFENRKQQYHNKQPFRQNGS